MKDSPSTIIVSAIAFGTFVVGLFVGAAGAFLYFNTNTVPTNVVKKDSQVTDFEEVKELNTTPTPSSLSSPAEEDSYAYLDAFAKPDQVFLEYCGGLETTNVVYEQAKDISIRPYICKEITVDGIINYRVNNLNVASNGSMTAEEKQQIATQAEIVYNQLLQPQYFELIEKKTEFTLPVGSAIKIVNVYMENPLGQFKIQYQIEGHTNNPELYELNKQVQEQAEFFKDLDRYITTLYDINSGRAVELSVTQVPPVSR